MRKRTDYELLRDTNQGGEPDDAQRAAGRGITPDELLDELDNGLPEKRREVLHEIIQDICHSFDLAMQSESSIDPVVRRIVNETVQDYIMNHYGDN